MAKQAILSALLIAVLSIPALAMPAEELGALDRLYGIDIPVQLDFKGTTLYEILYSMGKAAGFEVEFKGGIETRVVEVSFEEQPMKQALIKLAAKYDLAYEVRDAKLLVVRSRTLDFLIAALSVPALPMPAEEVEALDRLYGVDIPVQLEFKGTYLYDVLYSMGKAAGFEVKPVGGVKTRVVHVSFEEQPLKQVLIKLAERYALAYEVPEEKLLVVRDRTP